MRRIIEYKKYKEISNVFRERIVVFSKRFYKKPDDVELPKLEIDKEFTAEDIIESYPEILQLHGYYVDNETKKVKMSKK